MGNVFQPQTGHVLELRLSPPHVEPPLGSRGQRCVLFARVGTFEDRAASSSALWDEPVSVYLPSKHSAVLVSIYATEPDGRSLEEAYADGAAEFLAETVLPYAGVGGLAQLGVGVDGPPVTLQLALTLGERCCCTSQEQLGEALRLAREQFRLDMPCMALTVREVSAIGSVGGEMQGEEWKLPPARRQVIALELQNAALRERRRELSRNGDPAEPELTGVPLHVQQLQRIQLENEQLRSEKAGMVQKLEHTKSIMAGSQAQLQGQSQEHDWGRTLRVMQQELTHCRERQRKIRANYEDRIRGLQGQLQQALRQISEVEAAGAAPALVQESQAMQRRIDDATQKRDDLLQQLQALREKGASVMQSAAEPKNPAASPDVEQLRQLSEQHKAELAGLQNELAIHQEQEKGPEDQQDLRKAVEQLYEELDELHKVQEDERVRSESEVRELKIERDALKDKLDDAAQELQHLRAKADALRALRAEQGCGDGVVPTAAQLEELRAQNEKQAQELERLMREEADRKNTIRDLEIEQEALVEKTSLITTQALPLAERLDDPAEYARALEAKAASLQQSLDDTERACEQQRSEVDALRKSAEEAKARSQALRQSYTELQQLSDERVMNNPEPRGS